MRLFPSASVLTLILGLGSVASASNYAVDPLHSVVVFKISHLGASYTYGLVPNLEGSFSFDPEKPEESSIEVTVKVDALTTVYGQRDRHILNEDFLNAAKFPAATFKSTSWKKTGEKTYEISGDFTLLGTTKPVTVEAEFVGTADGRGGEKRAGFDGKLHIKRSDFGAGEAGPVGDDVWLTIGIEGIEEKAE